MFGELVEADNHHQVRFLTTIFRQTTLVEDRSENVDEGISPALGRGTVVVLAGWGSGGVKGGLDDFEGFRVEPAIQPSHPLESLREMNPTQLTETFGFLFKRRFVDSLPPVDDGPGRVVDSEGLDRFDQTTFVFREDFRVGVVGRD